MRNAVDGTWSPIASWQRASATKSSIGSTATQSASMRSQGMTAATMVTMAATTVPATHPGWATESRSPVPATTPTTARLRMKGSCACSGFESVMLRSLACARDTGSRRTSEGASSPT